MRILLWAECQKIRRSKIVWITIFATLMLASIVFIGGLDQYKGPEVHYGLKTVCDGARYIDNAGWYMDEAQPWATFFVLPSVIALLGSYMICREEEEDTLKSLRLIPINEGKLTLAKMIITFVFSILLYLLLFSITFLTEVILHSTNLSAELVISALKEYLLDGVGVFLAISPIIAFTSRLKKYWLALVVTEIYCVAGMFAAMSNVLKKLYPITAVFNLSGYHITTIRNRMGSILILLLCSCLAALILNGLNHNKKKKNRVR
ncbi:ABC transporter permease [Anaerosporobacter faecicola]|uniref:ABC transporter permease n=1 Tax=Anaerosporobacter faecicola TaxID=2718714 RepID=UPI00143B8689|nr:ABC transporter permease [Anaerosporobacter faecicola]